MGSRLLPVLGVLLAVAVGAAVWGRGASAQPAPPKAAAKWEYKVIDGETLLATAPAGEGEVAERALNKYGDEGWELVSVVNTGNLRWFWLKRPKDR